jgi:hypothetical protein
VSIPKSKPRHSSSIPNDTKTFAFMSDYSIYVNSIYNEANYYWK